MKTTRFAAVILAITLLAGPRAAAAGAPATTTGKDLSGTWKLDRAKSDSPMPPRGMHGGPPGGEMGGPPGGGLPDMGGGVRGPEGEGGSFGGGAPGMGGVTRGGGGGEGHHGEGGGPEGGPPREDGDRGMRRPGLPPYMKISSTTEVIAIADSAGATVQQITLKDLPADTPAISKSAPHVPGVWKNDKLTVTRTNSRGVKVTETFSLEDKGQTLVVKTKMEPPDGQGFEFKRVYRRAG